MNLGQDDHLGQILQLIVVIRLGGRVVLKHQVLKDILHFGCKALYGLNDDRIIGLVVDAAQLLVVLLL